MPGREELSDDEVERLLGVIEAHYAELPKPRGVPAREFLVRDGAFTDQGADGSTAFSDTNASEHGQEPDQMRLWIDRLKEAAVPVGAIAALMAVLVAWQTISSDRGKAPPGTVDPTVLYSPPTEAPPPPLILPPVTPTE